MFNDRNDFIEFFIFIYCCSVRVGGFIVYVDKSCIFFNYVMGMV